MEKTQLVVVSFKDENGNVKHQVLNRSYVGRHNNKQYVIDEETTREYYEFAAYSSRHKDVIIKKTIKSEEIISKDIFKPVIKEAKELKKELDSIEKGFKN